MPLEAPVTMATLEFLEDWSFVGIEEECDCMVVKVQLLLFVAVLLVLPNSEDSERPKELLARKKHSCRMGGVSRWQDAKLDIRPSRVGLGCKKGLV
jgi:hypothetical protein